MSHCIWLYGKLFELLFIWLNHPILIALDTMCWAHLAANHVSRQLNRFHEHSRVNGSMNSEVTVIDMMRTTYRMLKSIFHLPTFHLGMFHSHAFMMGCNCLNSSLCFVTEPNSATRDVNLSMLILLVNKFFSLADWIKCMKLMETTWQTCDLSLKVKKSTKCW